MLAASCLAGCGNSKASGGFDTSKTITVMSREDGSGTRGAFVELFGVEQKGLKLFGLTSEVIHQYPLIQHHLDEMVFFVLMKFLVTFPGFLFDEDPEVFLKHVHTPLESQFFADE